MKDVGQPGFGEVFPGLAAPLVGAITADYSTIQWWAEAMCETGRQLAAIRLWKTRNPTASFDDPEFQKLRQALAGYLRGVAANTRDEFGEPWGLIAMSQLVNGRAGGEILITAPPWCANNRRALAGAHDLSSAAGSTLEDSGTPSLARIPHASKREAGVFACQLRDQPTQFGRRKLLPHSAEAGRDTVHHLERQNCIVTSPPPGPWEMPEDPYSLSTNCAVKARNRMRACNCMTGSLVPVTWNEARKPARFETAARSSKVRNFMYPIPISRLVPSGDCWVDVRIQGRVVAQHIADGREAGILLHVFHTFERIVLPRLVRELDVVAHLRLAGLGIHAQVVEGTFGFVNREGHGCLPGKLAERNRAAELRFVFVSVDELVHIASPSYAP